MRPRDCDALLNTYAGPITADVMAQMPKCKIIARYGIGVDTIDLDAATQAGIIVTNNPTYCIEEVAEHTMALLLAAARKIVFYDRLVRAGRWEVPPGKPLFRLAGSTLGLIGFGNIARQVAVRAAAFGMTVLYAIRYVKARPVRCTPAAGRARRRACQFRFCLAYIRRSCRETRGMIGDDAFRQDEAERVADQLFPWAAHRYRLRSCGRSTPGRSPAARSTRPIPSRCLTRIPCGNATTSSSIRMRPGTASRQWSGFRRARRAKSGAFSRANGR